MPSKFYIKGIYFWNGDPGESGRFQPVFDLPSNLIWFNSLFVEVVWRWCFLEVCECGGEVGERGEGAREDRERKDVVDVVIHDR